MSISVEDVEYVAELSRLVFSNEEKERIILDLSAVVEYANKIAQLNTEDIEPTVHVLPVKNVFREDEIRPSMDRQLIVDNAPDVEDGSFVVPKAVE